MLPPVVPFSIETPRSIHFGVDSIQKLREVVMGFGHRVLLVSGTRWLEGSGWGQRLAAALEGCAVARVGCPAGEPTTLSLSRVMERAGAFDPEVILGIGGGSVIDTAKALSALLRHAGPVERFLEGVEGAVPIPGACIPWVGIPTTAGTGAEVTKNAVVRAESLGVKRSMRSVHLLAAAVIVDPQLTVSLPLAITGTSGLDALTQLVEAYVSRRSNPYVRALVRGAFGPLREALAALPGSPGNLALRSAASYGALVSGVALANAGLGAAHGFAAAVGGLFDVPHGLACAVFLPHVLEANAEVIRGALGELAAGYGGGDPVGWLAAEVRGLLRVYGLPPDLRGFAIPREAIPELADKSSGSSMKGNPRDLTREERIGILSRVM